MRKKERQSEIDKIKRLIGVELPADDFELLKDEDKEAVNDRYQNSKKEIQELINTFEEKGYKHGTSYLENLATLVHSH